MLLTAAALATSRIRLGTLVTPVARRRPEQLARQVATLDSLSGGRVIFSAGLGGPIEDEYGSFGDPTDPIVLAERLDEGLELLSVTGPAKRSTTTGGTTGSETSLLPASVQRPRPPVWIAGYWPHRRPIRRAARGTAQSRCSPPPVMARSLRSSRSATWSHTSANSAGSARSPFEIVLGGVSPGDTARAQDLSCPWPTPAPPGGTNGSSRRPTTSTGWHRSCGASSRGHPPSSVVP